MLYDGLSINIACKMYVIGVNEITWDMVAIVRGIMERNVFNGFFFYKPSKPIPVAARSKAWVCGCRIAGIVGSNPTGGMDV